MWFSSPAKETNGLMMQVTGTDSRKDLLVRKGQAWNGCNKLLRVWQLTFQLPRRSLSCIKSFLLNGAKTWTMKKELQDRMDGTYTYMCVKKHFLETHPTKEQIYGELLPVTTTVVRHTAIFAGHCYRSKDQIISGILLWRLPNHPEDPGIIHILTQSPGKQDLYSKNWVQQWPTGHDGKTWHLASH